MDDINWPEIENKLDDGDDGGKEAKFWMVLAYTWQDRGSIRRNWRYDEEGGVTLGQELMYLKCYLNIQVIL